MHKFSHPLLSTATGYGIDLVSYLTPSPDLLLCSLAYYCMVGISEIALTPELDTTFRAIAKLCDVTAMKVSGGKYDIRRAGAFGTGVQCKGFPFQMMLHDGFENVTFPDADFGEFEVVLVGIQNALSENFQGCDLLRMDKENFRCFLRLRIKEYVSIDIVICMERLCLAETYRTVALSFAKFNLVPRFIMAMKAWGIAEGVMGPDYTNEGRFPETAFTIMALYCHRPCEGGKVDPSYFFESLKRLPNEALSCRCGFHPRKLQEAEFIFVTYPHSEDENAALAVDPEVWNSVIDPAIDRALRVVYKRKEWDLDKLVESLLA
jgi:hypothetical protein